MIELMTLSSRFHPTSDQIHSFAAVFVVRGPAIIGKALIQISTRATTKRGRARRRHQVERVFQKLLAALLPRTKLEFAWQEKNTRIVLVIAGPAWLASNIYAMFRA